jgi:hypothetical protein
MWKVNRWQTTDDGHQVMVKAHILVGSNYGRSSIEIAHFIPIPQTEHKYDLSRISW